MAIGMVPIKKLLFRIHIHHILIKILYHGIRNTYIYNMYSFSLYTQSVYQYQSMLLKHYLKSRKERCGCHGRKVV